MASQITGVQVVSSTVCSCVDQRKHHSFAWLAFVRGSPRDRWIPRTKGQSRGIYVSIWWRHHGKHWIETIWYQDILSYKDTIISVIVRRVRYIGSGRNWHLLSFSLWDGWYSSVVGTPTWSVKICVWYRCLVATWCRPIHGYLMLNIFRHSSRLRNTLYAVKLILWLGKLIISIVSVACNYWSMTCPQTWFG